MMTIELFCGTKSFSKVMEAHGHHTLTIDNDSQFYPDIECSVIELHLSELGFQPDIIWASPPCEGFSVAAIGKNWKGGYRGYVPKSESARRSIELAKRTLYLIEQAKPKYWFIENPRGLLRKMGFMDDFLAKHGAKRVTVSYCQYGDTRMKPTDIWTNALWWEPKPICKNGMPCSGS